MTRRYPAAVRLGEEKIVKELALKELVRTSNMLREYAPDIFPEVNELGQVHFGRAMMESAAESIDAALSQFEQLRSLETDYAVNLGKEAYEAYCRHTGWKSLATGADLPQWPALKDEIRQAWMVTAAWVVGRVIHINKIDEPKPFAADDRQPVACSRNAAAE